MPSVGTNVTGFADATTILLLPFPPVKLTIIELFDEQPNVTADGIVGSGAEVDPETASFCVTAFKLV